MQTSGVIVMSKADEVRWERVLRHLGPGNHSRPDEWAYLRSTGELLKVLESLQVVVEDE